MIPLESVIPEKKIIYIVECSSFFDMSVTAFLTKEKAEDFIENKPETIKHLYYIKEAELK